MRLSKIKLAGFKSFVDPTTINLLSNLTAVAGPNGCGKSNVIDAVRWVMGESSAKHLRGGSLTDVIFSGSHARKPVGQATVELLFDNSEGKIGGEYASYAEIAIKRQVTRDGQSNYFLNGQRCRRRDITDIFLGTGLGPRSYAIIEQGMISRVIDAKPEDLRQFLEEAAGISKYKERRRETENRIRHTQENLARLNDLQSELEKQLSNLQRQSQAAQRYKALKGQEQEISAQLAALSWKRVDQEIKQHEGIIREVATELEREQAGYQGLKTQQEKQRIVYTESNEALNEVQKRYYAIGADITKIEQALVHQQERQLQLLADKKDAEESLKTSQTQLDQDKASISKLEDLLSGLLPQHEQACEKVEMAIEAEQQAEEALEQWREDLAELQQAKAAPSRLAEAEKAKIAQLERQIHQTQERMQRLEGELAQQQALQNDDAEIDIIDEKIRIMSEKIDDAVARQNDCALQKEHYLNIVSALRPKVKETQLHLNEMQGQKTALQALQAAALNKDETLRNQWLAEHGLQDKACLAELIEVEKGWEIALETVMNGFLQALGIEHAAFDTLFENAQMNLIEWQRHVRQLPSHFTSILHHVKKSDYLPEGIYHFLSQIRVCDTMSEAKAQLAELSQGGSLITREGIWMGQGWIKVKAKSSSENQTSILVREELLKNLSLEFAEYQEKLADLLGSLEENEEKLKEIDVEKESLSNEKNHLQQQWSSLQSDQKIKKNRLEQSQKRLVQIQQDKTECYDLIQNCQQEVNASRNSLHEALEKMAESTTAEELLTQSKHHLQETLSLARSKVKEISSEMQQIAMNLQTYKTQIQSLNANVLRFVEQIDSAQVRVKNIILALEKNEEPVLSLKETLEVNLEKRITIENELHQARDSVAHLDNQLREIEQKINQHDQNSELMRQQLEQTKMAWQALLVRMESIVEKLKLTSQPIEQILTGLPCEANEVEWQNQLSHIEGKIQRLGAINLVAIEEYQEALQRKEYMDSQCKDLNEALMTLETAIKKIDRETRAKFKETFDKVNVSFTQLFPQLFGGGYAELVMTGEELLDAGVNLIARPPGKKNSTISQLSGGEKALTAVALVFSLFQLNPAPFCMLDEVDAPLDDNNVGRFCDLVKQMSKTIQFIYVSHNKLAIEMAEQLQGVTMREPGVSRLVTVDIEQAKSIA